MPLSASLSTFNDIHQAWNGSWLCPYPSAHLSHCFGLSFSYSCQAILRSTDGPLLPVDRPRDSFLRFNLRPLSLRTPSWQTSLISSIDNASRTRGIEIANAIPKIYLATYDRFSCSFPLASLNSARITVKMDMDVMKDKGRKTIVTIVKTMMTLPWRVWCGPGRQLVASKIVPRIYWPVLLLQIEEVCYR